MVDPRLLQANERTLLAWVRTSIALMTFGFLIERIGVWLRALAAGAHGAAGHEFGTAWVGGAFVAIGVIANALATFRYAASRGAIRRGEPIPDGPLPIVLSVLVTALGAIIGIYLLARLR